MGHRYHVPVDGKNAAARRLERDDLLSKVQIFDSSELSSAIDRAELLDREQAQRQLKELASLAGTSPFRLLSTLGDGWRARIDLMKERQPNMCEVIDDAVLPSLEIRAAGGFARPSPILLVGGPGTGKTHFGRSLARALRIANTTVDMAAASSSAALIGLSMKWGNGGPGMLFRLLSHGDGRYAHADPVICVDELDKACVGEKAHMDPVGSLYSLLETETAKRFEDESIPGLHIDTSHVRWILCANTVEGIPSPILNRCQVFEIRGLTNDEKREIYPRLFRIIVFESRLEGFDNSLPTDVIESCLDLGTREFKSLCLIAIGRAVREKHIEVTPLHFRTQLPVARKRIGFQ